MFSMAEVRRPLVNTGYTGNPKRRLTVVVGGDVCPMNVNEAYCARGDVDAVFDGLLDVMLKADLCLTNLECPLIPRSSLIRKPGARFGARREVARVLTMAGIHAVGLANNHIMDYGPEGLKSTIEACEENGIAHFGAGLNLEASKRILVREIDGCRIGLLGVTHHEFSVAGRNSPGAAPMDALEVFGQINHGLAEWDVLLALVHAGPDRYPLATPVLQKYCRFLIDMGVSLVVCQHSHCPGSYEQYRSGLIVYGQGNLLFDLATGVDPGWSRGFLVEIEIENGTIASYRFVPYEVGSSGVGVRRMEGESADRFLRGIDQTSRSLSDPAELEAQWRDYCTNRQNSYYQHFLSFLPGSKLLRRAADRLGFSICPYSSRQRKNLLNLVRCEAHREALEALFQVWER